MIGSIEATSTPIVSQSISRQPSHLYKSRHDPGCNRRQGNCRGLAGVSRRSQIQSSLRSRLRQWKHILSRRRRDLTGRRYWPMTAPVCLTSGQLLSWVRTGKSLIAFGFAIYNFHRVLAGDQPSTHLIGPHEFALIWWGLGWYRCCLLRSNIAGTLQYLLRSFLRFDDHRYRDRLRY